MWVVKRTGGTRETINLDMYNRMEVRDSGRVLRELWVLGSSNNATIYTTEDYDEMVVMQEMILEDIANGVKLIETYPPDLYYRHDEFMKRVKKRKGK